MSAPTIDFEALASDLQAPRPASAPVIAQRWTREQLHSFAAPMRLRMELDELTLRRLDRTVRELRERGMPFPSIAVALDLYEGLDVTAEDVRSWCYRLGFEKNPNKARCFDHVHEARRAA